MRRYFLPWKPGSVAILSILLWLPLSTRGMLINGLGLNLGVGDGIKLTDQKDSAEAWPVVAMSLTPIQLNDGWQNEIVTYAQNVSDLNKTFYLNASVSLDLGLFGGSASADYSLFNQQTFSANTLTFVFTKTRNFGTTLFAPLGLSANASDLAAYYQEAWQGEPLYTRLTSEFGTHYVRGYQQAAFVGVAYTFTYNSSTVKQIMNASASASGGIFDSASFSGFVASFFSASNTAVSLSYQYISSDNLVPTNGVITTYGQFTNFVTQLEKTVNNMTVTDAVTTAWVVDQLESVPGYLSLVGGYVPPPVQSESYDDFFQAYTALQVWQSRLDSLIADGLDWLNPQGQQMVETKAEDIGNYLNGMTLTASNYFATGSHLSVPSDVITYLANMSDLKLPEIYVMDNFINPSVPAYRFIFGRVDAGPNSLVKAIPFSDVAFLHSGTNDHTDVQIFSQDAVTFETNTLSAYKTGTVHDQLTNLFASAMWACLTNPATDPDLNIYFLAYQPQSQEAQWSVTVGTNIDTMGFFDTRSGGCGSPSLVSNTLNVAVSITPPPTNGVVGLTEPFTVQITNQTTAQAYGTTIAFTLNDAFDYGMCSGSQGCASFDTNNRTVTCAVGPLLPGASASLTLALIPLQAGQVSPGSPASLTLGTGLTNSSPPTAPFSPIQADLPVVNMTQGPNRTNLIIDWWSDTSRLFLENSLAPGSAASWSPMTNDVPIGTHHLFLSQQAVGKQGYFRLHGQ